MSPKEYLQQIRLLDIKINHRRQELNSLKKLYLPAVKSDGVQANKFSDTTGSKVVRIESIENEINNDINELIKLRHKIIGEIHSLNNSLYIDILYKRYIEYKNLKQIADEMNYSFIHIRRCHGYALLELKKFLNDDTQ